MKLQNPTGAGYHTGDYWLPEHNFRPGIFDKYDIPEKVTVYDVSLREIDQTPGAIMRGEEKIEMAKELGRLGSQEIEIFPIVSQEDYEALKEISSWKDRPFGTSGLARTIKSDIDTVAECGADRITLETPISMAIGGLYKHDSYDSILNKMLESIEYAHSLGLKVTCEPWDIGKVPVDFIERFYKTIAQTEADCIVFADTYDNLLPWTTYNMVKEINEWVGDSINVVPHFHNEFGLATANTLAAVAAGCKIVHGALNSVGEKSGNAAIEELIVCMELLMGIDTGYNMELFYPVAKKFAEITKTGINYNKPIIGRRIFAMGSGLLAEAYNDFTTDEERAALQPFNPKLIGAPEMETIWGKGVGAKMIEKHAKKIGLDMDRDTAREVRDRIKHEAMIRKAVLSQFECEQYMREACK